VTKYLVTGGCGFIGSNIAADLITESKVLCIFDSLDREAGASNLAWLRSLGPCEFVRGDIRNANDVESLIKRLRPDVIFHLAGQVAMTTSIADPRRDYEVNVTGTINVLESVRQHCAEATLIFSSSNKVYGNLDAIALREGETRYSAPAIPDGIDENAQLSFHTPYGCSKGAADQYVLDYARCFGLNTVVFRHSTVYGSRQFATFDQGWVGWFCRQAVETKATPNRPPFTISGNGKQVRDLLFVDDAVRCYRTAAQRIAEVRGEAFNIGGGIGNSFSLLELLKVLEERLQVRLRYKQVEWRQNDQRFFVADISKARALLGWKPLICRDEGLERTIEWATLLARE
jgi:CDP-paratose 2-epimerase